MIGKGGTMVDTLFGFTDKTVVITGSSSGMGHAACELLLKLGALVYTVNRRQIDLPVHRAIQADLGSREAIDQVVSQLPDKIDALFQCQGMASVEGNELQVQKVNFLSQRFLTELLLPRMVDNGSVTLISSTGGYGWDKNYETIRQILECTTYEECVQWYEAHPEALTRSYPFSKQCLNAFVQRMAFDPRVIDRKIRINAICPGNTITGLTDEFNRNASPTGNPEEGKAVIERIFLSRWNGRWATAEEMGHPLVAIGSQIFSYMNGQLIYLDYGLASTWDIDALEGQQLGGFIKPQATS